MLKYLIFTLATCSLMYVNFCCAGFQEGLEAANKGDFATALKEWQPLADLGNPQAQFNLGLMYSNGRGVPHDNAKAVHWFRKSAEQGKADAQNSLGWAYTHGAGILQDFVQAANWFKKSARQGAAYGQRGLGCLYRDGKGVPQNPILAYSWLNLASAGGHPSAARERDIVARTLTAAELQQGQQLASSWKMGTLIPEVVYRPQKNARFRF